MSVFVISDLHLSTAESTDKSMEVFGNRWQDYENKIKANWTRLIDENDTVIIPGDISWATLTEEAKSDFAFISSLPGKKIIGKGNHDFWWATAAKLNAFFEKNGFKNISLLYNNAHVAEKFIITGTRGWFFDEENGKIPENSDYDKLIGRESARLKMSLDAGKKLQKENPDCEMIAFLHFPPIWNGIEVSQFCDLLSEYGIKRCYFGHIHGTYNVPPEFTHKGVRYTLISADYISFVPKLIPPLG